MSRLAQAFATFFGLLLLGGLVALPDVAAEGAKPAPLALLVGVTNYEGTGLGSLKFATRDVDELAAELKKQGFRTKVLKNNDATKSGIEAALKDLAESRQKGQMLLVALSGHGTQSIGTDGKEDAYFCPSDTDKARGTNLLSLSELMQAMGSRGTNLLLVDACRNDPKRGFKNIEGNELNGKLPAQTAVLFSCGAGQSSLETNLMYGAASEKGHGVFFYHVLEGLCGKALNADGKVEWYDLVRYVKHNVNVKAKEWEPGRARAEAERRGVSVEELKFQNPHLLNNLDDSPVLATIDARREPTPGEERDYEIARGVKMKFCWIPPGRAQLGSPKAERDAVWEQIKKDYKEEPEWLQSEAEEKRGEYRSKGFWLGKYPVTQGEWLAVMEVKNPSRFCKDGDGKDKVPEDTSRFPVEQVSAEDAEKFLEKLNGRVGREELVRTFGTRGKFVLPHEDEWEYACRGGKGNRQPYYFGNELNGKQANCNGTVPFGTETKGPYLERTTEVGSYARDYPHPWGLCDMHGNVYQWCQNNYNNDPKIGRVVRGGSWSSGADGCRAAHYNGRSPAYRNYYLGCRVCFRLD
jgi:formylglycine-generating enzyme